MRRPLAGMAVAVGIVVVAGCGVAPHGRAASAPLKVAAGPAQAASVLARYAVVRADSAKTADYGQLGEVESGTLLNIERTTYYVSRALGVTPGAASVGAPTHVWSGAFTKYPLWFAAVVPSTSEKTQVALVFARRSSTEPWRAVMGPRLAQGTELPKILTDDGGSAAILGDRSAASSVAATSLARHYADVLGDPRSPFADQFEQDSFITQMRQLARAQPREHIVFRQEWSADPVRYAFRLADGGVLMFVDLHCSDYYEIQGKHSLGFAGSEAAAFIPEPVHHDARLDFQHEVLLIAPADGRALVIGQFGGLVTASGR